MAIATKQYDNLSADRLEDDEGVIHDMYHMKLKLPWYVRDRSAVVSYYRRQLEDGSLNIISSTFGNEDYEERHKDLIGKDVVASQLIGSTTYKPHKGGVEVTMIQFLDLAGWFTKTMKDVISSGHGFRHAREVVE